MFEFSDSGVVLVGVALRRRRGRWSGRRGGRGDADTPRDATDRSTALEGDAGAVTGKHQAADRGRGHLVQLAKGLEVRLAVVEGRFDGVPINDIRVDGLTGHCEFLLV